MLRSGLLPGGVERTNPGGHVAVWGLRAGSRHCLQVWARVAQRVSREAVVVLRLTDYSSTPGYHGNG